MSDASERTSGRASGPVLTFQFLTVLNHCALCSGWTLNELSGALAEKALESCSSYTDANLIHECCDEGCYYEEAAEMKRACGTRWLNKVMCRVAVL